MDFSKIKTQSAFNRQNQVVLSDVRKPDGMENLNPIVEEMRFLAKDILTARANNAPVIMFIGAHIIKCGLSIYVIELIKKGIVTHIAGNGAVSIHDFELAYLGATSENVPTAIEDGTFGMWEETGAWMNKAICQGDVDGAGYGEAIARYIDRHRDCFPHRDLNILYQAFLQNIPATIHASIGTDIIHQHPLVNFAAIGSTSGRDFYKLCESVSVLEGGVFMNFGSAVTGPEVFLKTLSIARNLGYPLKKITTANFDLHPLGDYKTDIGYNDPNYYYRPRKNVVNRPTQNGGQGWHFEMNHIVSIPCLYSLLV